MPVLSFQIQNSTDFFSKLVEELNDFKNDPTSSRKAVNCAMTAWHMIDWIYNEFPNFYIQYQKLKDFQRMISLKI